MPKIGFDPQFKRQSFFDYPKLKLDRNDKARVTIVDAEPVAEFVHSLRKVELIDGRPTMKTESYGRDGEKSRDVPETEFLGKYLCLGDDDVLNDRGSDPQNCPACAASIRFASALDAPRRRIVFHVLRYATKTGSFEVAQPFQANLLAWEMPDTRFATLIDIASEHGDIRQIDLCLGPCTKPAWQTYDISPGAGRTLDNQDNRQRAMEIIKENRADDLTPLLGRKASPEVLQGLVDDIVQTWQRAFPQAGAPTSQGSNGSTKPEPANSGLDFTSLLGGGEQQTSQAAAAPAQPADAPNLSSLAEDAPAEQPKAEPQKVSKTNDIPDLESILGGLS